MKHNSGEWVVRPDYGKENVYRLWDGDTNYHEDTSPETMDANARLMSLAPKMLEVLNDAFESLTRLQNIDGAYRVTVLNEIDQILRAIKQPNI